MIDNNKPGDFGGVPRGQFDDIVKFYTDTGTNAALMTNGQAVKVLAELAAEERAALRGKGAEDILEVMMKCVDIRDLHADITTGGGIGTADAKGQFPKVDKFIQLLSDLKTLWG